MWPVVTIIWENLIERVPDREWNWYILVDTNLSKPIYNLAANKTYRVVYPILTVVQSSEEVCLQNQSLFSVYVVHF